MPATWIHASMDLMAFGRSYFDLHKYKDHPWKTLGFKHRRVHHKWYQEYGKQWNFDEAFPSIIHMKTNAFIDPSRAEKYQSWVAHDYLDRIWDTLKPAQRRQIEKLFKWYLNNPAELNKVYEMDVFKGLICRVINGKSVVEKNPELIGDYRRLLKYVSKIKM